MAYIVLADLKAYLMAGGQTPPTTDDALLTNICKRAQGIMERKTQRKFESRVETRLFDYPHGRKLALDDDLLSVTTLTNGDGTVVPGSAFHLLPKNYLPARAIELNQGSQQWWLPGPSGSLEQIISVAGTWGYMAVPNDDVIHTTIRLASWLYRQKDSLGDMDRVIHAPDGSTIMPAHIPADVVDMIYDLSPKF